MQSHKDTVCTPIATKQFIFFSLNTNVGSQLQQHGWSFLDRIGKCLSLQLWT